MPAYGAGEAAGEEGSCGLYCITHGEWRDAVEARHRQILAAMPTEVNPDLIASLRPKE